MSLALLLAPTFVLGISPALLPTNLFWMAAAVNVCAAALLLVHLWHYLRSGPPDLRRLPGLHILAFGSLGVILAIAVLLLLPGVWSTNASGPMRIFYLHDLLLGWVSTLLLLLIDARFALVPWRRLYLVSYGLWELGVVVMLAALLGLGLVAYIPLSALLLLQIAAWASIAPAAAALLLLLGAAAAGGTRSAALSAAPLANPSNLT
jgi:hypothetical protein